MILFVWYILGIASLKAIVELRFQRFQGRSLVLVHNRDHTEQHRIHENLFTLR